MNSSGHAVVAGPAQLRQGQALVSRLLERPDVGWIDAVVARLHEVLGIRRRIPHLLRSEEHTSELQSLTNLVCRLLLEKKKQTPPRRRRHGRGLPGRTRPAPPALRAQADPPGRGV